MKKQEGMVYINDFVVEITAKYFGLEVAAVTSECRKEELVQARYISMYILHSLLCFSYKAIGRYFSTDHSTVRRAIMRVEEVNGMRISAIYLKKVVEQKLTSHDV